MSYKIYLFDFDYTLANSEVGIVKCFELLMEQEGYPLRPKDEIKKTIGLPMSEALSILTGEVDEAKIQELKDKYTVFADLYMTENTYLYNDTKMVLKTLKERGAKIAIISSKTRRRIMQTLTRDKIDDLVEFIIGSEDKYAYKPAPDGILEAVKRLNVDKKDVIYIGDNIVDAQAAQNAQVDFAGVLTGNNIKADFAKFPHVKIMNCLQELI